jgi:membrane carboxypeptidase/penicillin-binding protein
VRAGVKNLENRHEIQGGSTLTMQLVRNLYTGEKQRTLKRKIREAKLAEDLENLHPGREGKLWILTKYLNSVPFGTVGGQTAVGIQAGARLFFDKPASELKLREAALLAGLPQAPSQYNPFLSAGAAKARRDDVLQRMADQGYIKQSRPDARSAWASASSATATTRPAARATSSTSSSRSSSTSTGLDTVRRGGLRIDTTIDLRLQRLARKTMDGNLGAADRSPRSSRSTRAPGYIKAMASSSRYGDSKFNLAAQGHRQAGSTFKVMVLMAALRRGVDPNSTTYTSRPLQAGWLPAAPDYSVHTYGNTYAGRINLVKATLKSDNSVYAQLDADVGPDAVRRTAYDMGIKTRLHAYPGRGPRRPHRGVSPLEMANAYSTIAAGGWRHRPIAIARSRSPTATSTTSASRAAPRVLRRRDRTRRRRSSSRTSRRARLPERDADRLPRRRQDRHDRQLHRRLVRRVHPAPDERGLARPRDVAPPDARRRRRHDPGQAVGPVHEAGARQVLRRVQEAEDRVPGASVLRQVLARRRRPVQQQQRLQQRRARTRARRSRGPAARPPTASRRARRPTARALATGGQSYPPTLYESAPQQAPAAAGGSPPAPPPAVATGGVTPPG